MDLRSYLLDILFEFTMRKGRGKNVCFQIVINFIAAKELNHLSFIVSFVLPRIRIPPWKLFLRNT